MSRASSDGNWSTVHPHESVGEQQMFACELTQPDPQDEDPGRIDSGVPSWCCGLTHSATHTEDCGLLILQVPDPEGLFMRRRSGLEFTWADTRIVRRSGWEQPGEGVAVASRWTCGWIRSGGGSATNEGGDWSSQGTEAPPTPERVSLADRRTHDRPGRHPRSRPSWPLAHRGAVGPGSRGLSGPAVAGTGTGGLPESDFLDGQPHVPALFEDQPGDVLGGGIRLHHEDGLSMILQDGQQRIVDRQQHLVIQRLVDPGLQQPLDVSKVNQHSS